MNIQTIKKSDTKVAIVSSSERVITDVQSALDFMMTIQYETGCDRIAVNKEAVAEDFFILSTRLAGEILQKFINYQVKFAVYGNYSQYTSKSLKDFIYESNKGKDFFFAPTLDQAVEMLAKV